MDTPEEGERIIVTRRQYLGMYFDGKKRMEVFHSPLRRCTYVIGCDGLLWARVRVTGYIHLKTRTKWRRFFRFHRENCLWPLYGKHTWGTLFYIEEIAEVPFPYDQAHGTHRIVEYKLDES